MNQKRYWLSGGGFGALFIIPMFFYEAVIKLFVCGISKCHLPTIMPIIYDSIIFTFAVPISYLFIIGAIIGWLYGEGKKKGYD